MPIIFEIWYIILFLQANVVCLEKLDAVREILRVKFKTSFAQSLKTSLPSYKLRGLIAPEVCHSLKVA